MFSEALRFRRRHLEIHGAGDPAYAAMYAFKEYPATTWPGMFHGLAVAPYRCTLMQSYRFLSNAAGMGAVGRKQNKMLAAGDKALSQSEALTEAADELMSRKWVLGDHSLVLIAFADSPRAIAEVGNAAWRDLAACGLVATRMTHALQAAYLSMLPGAGFWRPRPGFVKSSNFVAFAPLYNWPAGAERGHWPGPPIAIFRTLAGTPYRFHWQVGDVGNTLVTGATGSGKTTLVAFLIAMTAGRARIVALDHKRGWDLLIHRMGGDYAVLGAGEPHLAPLKALDAAPRNIEFLTELVRGCIGGKMTEEEGRRLALGLATIMELPPEDRGLGELRAFFDDEPEGAGARLDKWCWGGELGWVIDAPVDTVRFGAIERARHDRAPGECARPRPGAGLSLSPDLAAARRHAAVDPVRRGLAGADRPDLPRHHRKAAAHDPQPERRCGVYHPIAARHHRQRHRQHPGRAVPVAVSSGEPARHPRGL